MTLAGGATRRAPKPQPRSSKWSGSTANCKPPWHTVTMGRQACGHCRMSWNPRTCEPPRTSSNANAWRRN